MLTQGESTLLIFELQVEFDSPSSLIKKDSGILRALVEGSGEKENLVALVDSRLSTE